MTGSRRILRTRIAPTPSGYLHLGNAWSFVLTWLKARSEGGHLRLRIDDLDASRYRDEYLEDIFESLRWLGLDWDAGPRDAEDFKAAWSQRLRREAYLDSVSLLQRQGHLYACTCSREKVRLDAEAAGLPPNLYPGTCRKLKVGGMGNRGTESSSSDSSSSFPSLRFRMPAGPARARDAEGGAFDLRPDRDVGDVVLRQKNGDPSYQIASIADDEDAGINFVVRGLDLTPSTGAQLALASALGLREFPRARFWHHALVLNDAGEKLSKSRGAESLQALRARFPTPAPVYRFFGEALGISGAASARDLLPGFEWSRAPTQPLYLKDFWKMVEESSQSSGSPEGG